MIRHNRQVARYRPVTFVESPDERGNRLRAANEGRVGRECVVDGCSNWTPYRRPWCEEHVDHSPYYARIMRENAHLEKRAGLGRPRREAS